MLLAERRKDEIRVRNGNEGTLRLRSFFGALAPDPASAHRYLCLQNLVAGSPGIVVGIDESREPCLLVWLQEFAAAPAAHHQNHRRNNKYQRLLEVDAAEKHP